MRLYIYDLETLNNVFTFSGKFMGEQAVQVFELSFRKNQWNELLSWLTYLKNAGDVEMVGFNNNGFDYPIIHEAMNNVHTFTYQMARAKCMAIINAGWGGKRSYAHNINKDNRLIAQLDLYLINHFDNDAKRTSLKALQFAMRSQSVDDLPFHPDRSLTSEEIDLLITYNIHDVTETERFLVHCLPLIQMRREIKEAGVVKGDVMNYNDVKIGEQYLVSKIGRAKCYHGRAPKQTLREFVKLGPLILPKVSFRDEHFAEPMEWFKQQTVWCASPESKKLKFVKRLGGIDFNFGLGGVHASVHSKVFHTSKTHTIIDVDVAGMYVAVAIANGFYPEHLGQDFVTNYRQLQHDRAQYKKGTSMNALLKLAGNGVYGKSNDPYSPFYDPKYTYTVTVNGQLQLLQLVEMLCLVPGLQLIQANTDGITALVPNELVWMFDFWKREWETETGYKLEEVKYKSMFIRDVNNYIAVKTDGSVKRKGAYWYPESWAEYEGVWHKDHSCQIVQKITSEALVNDWNPEALIYMATDAFDFMLRHKTGGTSKVYIGDKLCPKTVRYYVSTKGEPMIVRTPAKDGMEGQFKRKPGLKDSFYNSVIAQILPGTWDARIHTAKKTRYEETTGSLQKGWKVKLCNNASDFDWSDVDYDYYIEEAKKLLITGE